MGVMNTYYLKKFRKEAYKLYGLVWFENTRGDSVWNVGVRTDLKPSFGCMATHCYSENEALDELKRLRRVYVLSRVRVMIYDREIRENNKRLAKL